MMNIFIFSVFSIFFLYFFLGRAKVLDVLQVEDIKDEKDEKTISANEREKPSTNVAWRMAKHMQSGVSERGYRDTDI